LFARIILLGCEPRTWGAECSELERFQDMSRVGSRALGLLVIGAVLYWASVALTMHILEPEFSPVRAPMSAYVLGAHGAWMTTTYPVLCVALLSAGLGLATKLPATRQTRTAFVFFLVAAAGALLAGIFPMDFPGPPRTASGRLHALGGALTFPAWVLGAFLFSLTVRRQRWRRGSLSLVALSAGSIGIFVISILSLIVLGYAGYAQRLLVALLFVWMTLVAVRLIRVPRSA
jgi:hypothetical membrane protein